MGLGQRLSRIGAGLRSARQRAAFLPPLLGRVYLFYAFHVSGVGKLGHLDHAASFAAALGLPAPRLYAESVAQLEIWGAVLLLIGLLTRPTAALLALSALVSLLTADREALLGALRLSGQTDVLGIAPLALLVPLLWLTVEGAGLLSVDGIVARLLRWQATSREHR
jgi:putative oxidoreductase